MKRFMRNIAEGTKLFIALFSLLTSGVCSILIIIGAIMCFAGGMSWKVPAVTLLVGVIAGTLCYVTTENL